MLMYIVAACVGAAYLVLFFLSRREVTGYQVEGLLRPFASMALYLYKKSCRWGRGVTFKSRVKRDLELLHPGEGKEQLYTAYCVKKTSLSLLICLSGTVMGLFISIQNDLKRVLTEEGTIMRTSYQEGAQRVVLWTKTATGDSQTFEVTVEPKEMSQKELEEKAKEFKDRLDRFILGENPSLQQVSRDLRLTESYEGFPFTVEWQSSRPEVLGSSGKVWEVTEATEVELKATVSYRDKQWEETVLVCVIPGLLSKEEQVHKELMEVLRLSEEESRREDTWKLPDTYGEADLAWKQVVKNYGLFFWGLAILVAVAVFVLSDKDLHNLLLKRRNGMKREYSDVVHTLVLYLGAGMTVRGAFFRMSSDKEGKARTPIYEEIRYTCRELQAGVSEGLAYEHLGKRTGLQEYVRLCTLLTQNLKKGNGTLLLRLKEEAARASTERIASVKKSGEEAGTKLLVPMVMMLAVVMLIIMIPAFMTMGQ